MLEEIKTAKGIEALLGAKTEAALRQMKDDLNKSLYGPSTFIVSPNTYDGLAKLQGYGPAKDTGSRYPKISGSFNNLDGLNQIIKDVYQPIIKQQLFESSPLLDLLKPKEGTMSDSEIVSKVMKERKEKRATEVIEYLEDYFGSVLLDVKPGLTLNWNVVFADGDKTYCYAAVRGDRKWYITYDRQDYTTDELIAKITELALRGEVFFPNDSNEPL